MQTVRLRIAHLFFACLCLIGAQSAQPKTTTPYTPGQAIEAGQWAVVDIRFQCAQPPANPVDIPFSALLTNDSEQSITVHGFYNGDNEYLIRFCPPTPGRWTFKTTSDAPSLHDLSGELQVSPAAKGHRGPISVNPESPRKFQYANGDLYYPIAYECDWLFALDAENPDGIPDTKTHVSMLAENGFNQVVMNVFAYDVKWPKDEKLKDHPEHEYGGRDAFPFGGTNENPDHSQLNIEFFQRLDRVIECLDDHEIASHLMIYVWNKAVNWPKTDSPEDNRYFDYVVKRYQWYPNIVWDVSKEALAYGHTDSSYITSRVDRLRELDTSDKLVTVHAYGYCRQNPDKIDFVSVQIWQTELYHVMRDIMANFPDQPVINIEHGGYERSPYVVFPGSYTSPEANLERAYKCVFAGAYPTHYWQGAAWNVIIADINTLAPEDRPRLDYYKHMRTLVDRYDLGNLIAGDKKCNSGFTLHNGTDTMVYFVPKESISIGTWMFKKGAKGMMSGIWFNPFDGTFSEPVRKKITQWPSFEKPAHDQFWILIVELDEPQGDTLDRPH